MLTNEDSTVLTLKFQIGSALIVSAGCAVLYSGSSAELRHDFLMARMK